MNQVKIGRFIAECRKKNHFTQAQLAEMLNITDRAVSKWETGKSLPDSSIMLELCSILKITVNDLLSGEVVIMEQYNEKLETHLLEIIKEKELADKRLLSLEIVIGVFSSLLLFVAIFIAAFVPMEDWMKVLFIIGGVIPFAIGMTYAIKIEQVAGYYECAKCHHKYVPAFRSVVWSMHINRTRYMKCPNCSQKSWQKKVLKKD